MVNQKDVDTMLAEMEHARRVLKNNREAIYPQIQGLVDRAEKLHRESIGGKFEPALNSVHNLLTSMQRGLKAQETLMERSKAA